MSVYKSKRSEAAVQYIATARDWRKYTMDTLSRFPKRYHYIMTNGMLEMAREVYLNCIKANAIYLHKGMSENDYELRHRYLTLALTNADALLSEITFCYEIVSNGNNYFRDKKQYENTFETWVGKGNDALAKIKGVLESDKKRWNGWLKESGV
ncbi:MAG: hypothetical protein LUI02_06685 [Clostridiales bacterium]|nr:hypothetical protein [Clostridiales bacterium]